jgi:hypothetical protein
MEIRSIPGPQGLDALGATAAPLPQLPEQQPEPETSKSLEPAVKVDIGSDAYRSRFVRDTDTSKIVFQVVDSASGNVVDQLPSESALRNRAYASSNAKAAASAGLSRVA